MLRLQFEKLFGRFNYYIVLNPEGLTILIGPNGCGKTTILKSIEALSKGLAGILFFDRLDFNRIIIISKDDTEIILRKDQRKLMIDDCVIDCEFLKREISRDIYGDSYYTRIRDDNWFERGRAITISYDDYPYLESLFKRTIERMRKKDTFQNSWEDVYNGA